LGAWTQVYRALEHGAAKQACRRIGGKGFPAPIEDVARGFAQLQELRHRADYDPLYTTSKEEALDQVDYAEWLIDRLLRSRRRDRKAFAVWVLMRPPREG
jgi:hypothetical protein